ncbi:helix-turn-helix transcriptional regulator [Treponema primitia]|uniref:helix-turn-helix transcriptional regulator n=1 Tax=Treponema primitia TaxID=88058 RepID=UPI0002554F2A|nr:LuxR C-terminal-related transcriptional regulator [Treponema primitia]
MKLFKKISTQIQFLEMLNNEHVWGILAGLSFIYELCNLIAGDSVIGFLTVPIFYAFAQRSGFFKTRGRAKRFAMVLLFLAALASQYRFGISFLCKSFISIIATVILCVVGFLLFLPELQKNLGAEHTPVIRLSPKKFTRRDVDMLNKVLEGEKYTAIAAEYGLAESTLKNRLRILFNKIGVSDRISFLSGYARYILALEEEELPEQQAIKLF